jgi:hypothetical protein
VADDRFGRGGTVAGKICANGAKGPVRQTINDDQNAVGRQVHASMNRGHDSIAK